MIIIQPAPAAAVDVIMPTMRTAFDPLYGEAWTVAQCAGLLSLAGTWLLIARTNDEVSGFALTRVILDEAELLLLAVDQHHQKTGIGAALLNRVMDDAVERGARTLHLEVRSNNPAHRFYEKHGFLPSGIRKNYYRGKNGQLTDAVTLFRFTK